ncbi:MAG: prepilin-type N-terminal cleavage/methylation domain-containing protein [Puniceicoccales bacterium]|jgi:prepilin-type N-terminal cleavage/methylation domain-containing protein|nr:prepilin-type N-terminal cleavage/methylation domain-containing protein [Puniceicoccales bacterium]
MEHRGFSLMELLVVMTVIALLSALLLPAIRAVLGGAQRTKALAYMKQIARAYVHCTYNAESGLQGITGGANATAHDWIRVLAEQHYCNDPRVLMFDCDYLVKAAGNLPRRVWDTASQSLDRDFFQKPLSIAVVAGSFSTDAAIPICWTRGLQEDGYWAKAEGDRGGVFGTSGGIIAFTDGSAQWFDDLHGEKAPLSKWATGERSSNIYECLPPGSCVLDWRGVLYAAGPSSSGGGAHAPEPESQVAGDENGFPMDPVEGIEPSPEPSVGESYAEDDGAADIPYDSWPVEIDFANALSLRRKAQACGVGAVLENILDVYANLRSDVANAYIDSSLSQAFESLAGTLESFGINFDTSEEVQACFWSGFLGDEHAMYTDNTDVLGRDPRQDAADALTILNSVNAAIGGAYDSLDRAQKSQFAALLEAFSSGDEASGIDFDSDGAKLAQAYLDNQVWITAMKPVALQEEG